MISAQTNNPATQSTRPPLWLAAATVAAAWGAAYDVGRWIAAYVTFPAHEDVRIYYVAAEAGLRYGWSTIYDIPTLSLLSSGFVGGQTDIDSSATYISPPLLAWLFAPLTTFPEPVAYALWSAASVGSLLWMWHIAAPYARLAKVALLLLALALWPVLDGAAILAPAVAPGRHSHDASPGLGVARPPAGLGCRLARDPRRQ